MKIKVKTQYNYEPNIAIEHVDGETQTQSGGSYTIKELFEKHRVGLMPEIERKPIFMDHTTHDSVDMEHSKRLETYDKIQLQYELKSNLDQHITELTEQQTAKKLAKQKEQEKLKLAKERKKTDQKTDESESAAKTTGDN